MKKSITFLLLFSFLAGTIFAQYDPGKINPKAVAAYNDALEKAQAGNFNAAVELLQKSIELDNNYIDAYLALASVYNQMKNYLASTSYYEKAFARDSSYTIAYKLPYSINLAASGEFTRALAAINELLTKSPPKNSTSLQSAEYRKRCYEFAVEYARKNPDKGYAYSPRNMGSAINSAESEYWPSLTIDGKEFIFTRKVGGNNEDFFSSERNDTGWTVAKPIPGNVNTQWNEAAQNISLDGQWLVFTANNKPEGMGGFDIYISFLEKGGWSEGVNLGSRVNSDVWDSQPCLSPDKRDLYFASSRFGGYGGLDLYISHLQDDGNWSKPENLGPEINSKGNEQCPFMHADNQTLYFTSDYWPGYGSDDLFFSKKGPNDSWTTPVNLGYPINTIDKEGTLLITADGKTAYYTSDRADTKGGLDIYNFELREDIRPFKTLWVKGKVFDVKTSQGLPSAVELIDMATQRTMSRVQTDEKGEYMITLPTGKEYVFNVNRKGYLFYSGNFDMRKESPDSIYRKDIGLQPIVVNASMVLQNVFFDVNKFDLQPASQAELDKVVQFLNDNPSVRIEISGHTDNVGKAADNIKLSDSRAKTVVSYLINKRISPARLTFKGQGASKPVAPNTNEAGRAKNRRTELKVIAQ